jgi:predicted nucleotidyltransferase
MDTLENHPLDKATTQTIDAFLEKVEKTFPFSQAILFGSRARGDFNEESDADIAIILTGQSEKAAFLTTKLAMSDMAFDVILELDTGIRVQALPVWQDEWEHPEAYRNPALLHNIEHDGILIR